MLRDRVLGVTRQLRKHDARQAFFISSGNRKLACVYVPGIEGGAAVLLCHGIGETVENWSAVQALFHDHGIGSLVFNYSGYGKSSGKIRAEHCDEDLVAAYTELRRRVELQTQVFVLGFSLGSGIAAQGRMHCVRRLQGYFCAKRLIHSVRRRALLEHRDGLHVWCRMFG